VSATILDFPVAFACPTCDRPCSEEDLSECLTCDQRYCSKDDWRCECDRIAAEIVSRAQQSPSFLERVLRRLGILRL
jgi:hypothetical protein